MIWISSPNSSLWICVDVASTGFKRSLKYSLHQFKTAFGSFRVTPFNLRWRKNPPFNLEHWDLSSRKRRMVCRNTLFAIFKSSSNLSPNSKISERRLQPLLVSEIIDWKLGFSTLFHALFLDSSTFMAATLRASEYCERSSTDDLFKNQALKATFFCSNSLFNFLVPPRCFFSLLFVSPTRLRPQ